MGDSDDLADEATQLAMETNDPKDWEVAIELAREADEKNGN